jgi:hypothetical protein
MDPLRKRKSISNETSAKNRKTPIHLVQQSRRPSAAASPDSTISDYNSHSTIEIEAEIEISEAWRRYQRTEKDRLELGRVNHKWWEEFKTQGGVGNKGEGICAIWVKLNIPKTTAYRSIDEYMTVAGLSRPRREKRTNRAEPPDSFEVLRALAKKMLNLGFQELRKTNTEPSHLAAAKTWALCRLEEKQK